MRRIYKVLAFFVVLGIAALALLPILARGRVLALVLDQANAALDATVVVGDADLSLLADFPQLRLRLSEVAVQNHAPFAGTTLAEVGELDLSLDLGALLRRRAVELRGLALRRVKLTLLTDAEGRSNTDILPPSDAPEAPEEEGAGFSLKLERCVVEDLDLELRDGDLRVLVRDLDLAGRAELSPEQADLGTHTTVAALTVEQGGATLLREAAVNLDADVGLDSGSGALTLRESLLTVNTLRLALTGTAAPVEGGWELDLKLGALESSFKELLSLVPAVYSQSFAGLGSTGSFALAGAVKGLWPDEGDALPALDLSLRVEDGSFRDPALPEGVADIDLDLSLTHPGGELDALVVDLRRFGMRVGQAPLSGRLRLSHLDSDPAVDLEAHGDLDLAALGSALPASAATYAGRMRLDLALAGRVSAFEAEDFGSVKAEGRVQLDGVRYTDPELPVPLEVQALDLNLTPAAMNLAALRVTMQGSDLSAQGRLDNAVAWALSDAPLVGRLSLRSQRLDLDPWASEEEDTQAEASPESAIFVVPDGYDLVVEAEIQELIYGGEPYEDVRGTLVVRDGTLRFEDLRVTVLDGALGLEGQYSARAADAADVDLSLNLGNPELAALLRRSPSMRRLAAVVEEAAGTLRAEVRMKATLGPDLSPDLRTLWADGRVALIGVSFKPRFLEAVERALGRPTGRRLEVKDRELRFSVREGRTQLQPLQVAIGDLQATLGGSLGALDESLDLTLDLRLPAVSLRGTSLAAQLGERAGDTEVRVRIGGTRGEPKVKLELAGAAQARVDAVKQEVGAQVDVVKQEVTAQVDAAKAQALAAAQAQGDRLVAEAAVAAARVREEGQSAAAALRSEAKSKARQLRQEAKGDPLRSAAADKAADRLVSEAEDKARAVERESERRARALEEGAARRRDALIQEAEATLR